MKRLVITADDFGAAIEVNEAIEEAHCKGVLSATSLMAGAPAREDAVARAKRLPKLRVGLHLTLTEGRPVLPPTAVPDLVTAEGCFRTDMASLGRDIFMSPRIRAQLGREIEAQFEVFRRTGLELDHADAHQHYHLHPTVAGLMLEIGRRYGMRASRAPIEPRAVLRRIEPAATSPPALLTGPWARLVRMRFRRAGVLMADQVFGLAWSGAMRTDRLARVLACLPDGLTEIYLHPATAGGFEGSAPGYDYPAELAALTAEETRRALVSSGATLGGFSDFA